MGDQSAYVSVPKEGGGGTNVRAQQAQAYQAPAYAGGYGGGGYGGKQEIDLTAGYVHRGQTSLNKEAPLATGGGKVDQSCYMAVPK